MKEVDKATTEVLDAAQRIERLLNQQVAINQLALALGELNDLDSIYKLIHEYVSRFMDTNGFIVSTYDNSDQLIRARYAMLNGVLMDVGKFPPIPLEEEGKGIQSRIIRSKKPFYIPNVSEGQRKPKTSYIIDHGDEIVEGAPDSDEPDSVSSRLLVPMMFDGEVHGVMQVQSFKPDAYTQDDIDVLCSLANVAALTLQNVFYRNNLEMLVEERTKELQNTQEQLVRSERLAVLGKLGAGIGHELRNPLASIKGSVYFLKMALENPEDEIKETLDVLDQEVTNCVLIISSLLDFASPKAPTKQKTNVNEVINAALLRVDITEGIKLETDLDPKLPVILADPIQLSQVFINLIRNAVQAMENGGKLTINTDTSGPGYISIKITDTGSGITKEDLQKLFTPLFTTKAKGIGLGLAIAKTFIEAHEGTIDVTSSVGEGTAFLIKLPTRQRINSDGL